MRTRCALVWLLCTAAAAHSQTFAGGERENYLRYLQTVRLVPVYPWGARAFSPGEVEYLEGDGRMGGWADGRLEHAVTAHPPIGPSVQSFQWLPVAASVRFNSTFPYGYNDGPVWAGRGVTLAAEGGFTLR